MLFFVCFLGCFLFVFVLVCLEKAPQRLFSSSFRVFFYIVPPKGLSLKSFFSCYSVVFSLFSCCPPFQNSIFSLAFAHQPLFGKYYSFLVSSVFLFFCFPLLMLACFSETNIPNISLLKPTLLSFLVVYLFLQLFLFLFACFLFLWFCFLCWLCFWYVFLLFLFCFCFASCFAFRLWKKHCFPAILVFCSHVGYKVVYLFSFMCLFLIFSVVCFHLNN